MSDYIIVNGELYHHGIKGMKWGKRRWQNKDGSLTPAGAKRYGTVTRIARGHAGPGIYVGSNKRQIEKHKRDLEILDKGGHLSVGLTKKRQAAFDERDRKAINKKISKLESKERKKALEKEYGELEDQMTYGKKADPKKNAALQKRMSEIEKELNPASKKAAEKAAKKLAKTKMKDLKKQYGELEDQMTYGKNANTKKNAALQKRMSEIEKQMSALNKR